MMYKLFTVMLILIGLMACSDTVSSEKDHFDLPTEFPLEAGNAWIYERHFYESGEDSVVLDTLYIEGQYQDYYKYSWRPEEYYNLVKNHDNMLVNYGSINFGEYPDTFFYDEPIIWFFFGEDTGFVDFDKFDGYSTYNPKLQIGVQKDIEIFDALYDGFVATTFDTTTNTKSKDMTAIKDGFTLWRYYNIETGEKRSETILIEKLEDFFPDTNLPKSIVKNSKLGSKKESSTIVKSSDGYSQ